jgi:S-(hydroxymethyl)glutathione dehydrogenase/alcohol dehydrogenase
MGDLDVTTRAVVFDGVDGDLRPASVGVTAPGPTEVTVRVTASGVCHTDRHVIAGGLPVEVPCVLGHEGAGVVEAVGPAVGDLSPGDTVVLIAAPVCGRCWFCVRGEGHNCAQGDHFRAQRHFVVDGKPVSGFAGLGTFAERVTLDQASVVRVDTDLPAEHLALIGCGVITGVGAVLTSPVRAGSSVVVLGCGGVGLSVVQGARIAGAEQIVAVDPLPSKRDAALALGATVAVDPTADDVADVVRQHTGGRGADVAFEAIGSVATVVQGVHATRMGGTTYMIGVPEPTEFAGLSALDVLLGRKTLVGSIYGGGDPRRMIPTIVGLAESGRLDLDRMVTRRIGLDDVKEAMDAMDRGEVVRSVITFA